MKHKNAGPWRAVWVAVALGAMACHSEAVDREVAVTEEPTGTESVGAPFDVGAVIRQVQLAYRSEAGAWKGGHSTYAVRASTEGLVLTPFHHASAEAGPARPSQSSPARVGEVLEGAPLRLGAPRMTLGARPLAGARDQARVEQDGHLALARGGDITEHLRNSEAGIEQSWSFSRAPEGDGELLLRIPVEGLAFTGVTEEGLHFADARTGLGFRYGHATWVDGAGQRTSLPAGYEAGHIVLRVPQALLAASEYPAVLDPVISPEQGMDTPVDAPAGGTQQNPAVAFNGTHHLVVWQDTRMSSSPVLYGARVTSAGDVLDSSGLLLAADAPRQVVPAVDSNGVDWFVVWEDERNGAGNRDLYGARVSAAGAVVDTASLPITTAVGNQYNPAVAANGSDYLVVWQDTRSGSTDLYGARVTSTGTVVDPAGLALSTAIGVQLSPSVDALGTGWLVVWEDERNGFGTRDLYGTRVSGTGQVLEPTGMPISTATGAQSTPAVASNGTNALVVWQDSRSGSSDIYGARVSAAGVVLDVLGLPIRAAAGTQSTPAVASNGVDYLVAWTDALNTTAGDIHGARVSGAGQVLDTSPLLLSVAGADQRLPVLASHGTDYLAAWVDTRNGSSDIYGTRVTSAGGVLEPTGLVLSRGPNTQLAPAVASNGTHYLVVWQDWRLGADIYGVRVSPMGQVLDASGLAIHLSDHFLYAPALASNGTDWFVVWEDVVGGAERLYGTRVTSAGEVLDPTGLRLCTTEADQRSAAVASNGSDFFVVWSDSRAGSSTDIYGARVLNSGTVVDPAGLGLGTAAGGQFTPAVASNGTDYLVAWRHETGSIAEVFGTRVTSAGVVLDPAGLGLGVAAGGQYAPAVASDGTDYLVVWDDARNLTDLDVYGTRVTSGGTVVDPSGLAIAQGAADQRLPAVTFDGANYLVAWEHMVASSNSLDLRGARVSGTGTVLEPEGFTLAAEASNESAVSLASVGAQRSFLVYQQSQVYPQRVAGRLVSFATLHLTAPNGGEQWTAGSSQAITWTASGITQVRLEYSLDDGASWAVIATGVDAFTGSYAWVVPSAASAQARVRISDVSAGGPSDVSDGTFTILMPARLILNEILANEPGSNVVGEFVELVNVGGLAIDLSGFTVSDATMVRHTFAVGTVLGPRESIVVYGAASGIPAGLTNAVAATTGTLSLSNGGDTVKVKSEAGVVIDTFTYSSELSGTDGVSMNRNPDASATGSFVLHTTVSSRSASPGRRVDGSAF